MTEAEVKRIVAETVKETLVRLGIDADKPMEVQRDFQFLRTWRLSTATVGVKTLTTAVGIVIAGAIGLIYVAFKGS